jgi:hypothetical protein
MTRLEMGVGRERNGRWDPPARRTQFWTTLGLLVLAGPTLALLSGCRGKAPREIQPITPSIQINKSRAPIGSPIEVAYRFTMDPSFKPLPKDYRVFVHFLDSHGEQLFNDDHLPEPPTSSWKAGSTVEYTRTVFIPLYPYLGNATVEVGLYLPGDGERLALKGADNGQQAYRVGQIELLDQKENIFLVYKEGWHELEASPENPAVEWQWTKQEAVCSFKNPKSDTLLYLEADSNVSAFTAPLEVALWIGSAEVARFTVAERDPVLRKIPIPATKMGTDDWVDLRIVSNQSFVPSESGQGHDTRQLSLRVYHLYLDQQQPRT